MPPWSPSKYIFGISVPRATPLQYCGLFAPSDRNPRVTLMSLFPSKPSVTNAAVESVKIYFWYFRSTRNTTSILWAFCAFRSESARHIDVFISQQAFGYQCRRGVRQNIFLVFPFHAQHHFNIVGFLRLQIGIRASH